MGNAFSAGWRIARTRRSEFLDPYSETTSTRRVPILSTDDLGNLPEWRIVMFNSMARPVLLKALPWFKDKALRALIEQDDPAPVVAAAPQQVQADARG